MPIARTLLLLTLLASSLSAQLRPAEPVIPVGSAGWDELARPRVAMAPSGDFLVTWSWFHDDVLDARILSRLYRRGGVPANEAPVRIDGAADGEEDPDHPVQLFPRIAARDSGGFAVLWSNADSVPCYGLCDPPLASRFEPMSARFLNASGNPDGDPVPVADGTTGDHPRFVLDFPSGETLFLWTGWQQSFWTTAAQRFDPEGRPLSEPFGLPDADPQDRLVSAAALPDGGFLVLWARSASSRVQRYGPAGEVIGAPVLIDLQSSALLEAELVAQRDGSFAVAWTASNLGPNRVFLRLFGPAAPSREIQVSPPSGQHQWLQSLVADGEGDVLVVWKSLDSLHLQGYGRNGAARGEPVRVESVGGWGVQDARASTNGRGDWVVTWAEISETSPGYEVFAQSFQESCAVSSTRVCLAEGRFRVEVAWKDHAGGTGAGQARRLTEDTGAFWFFGADNVELVVKVLDGRTVNGHFWIFAAGLTDVEYDLTVRDMQTGEERVHHHVAGTLESRADVLAFRVPEPPALPEAGADSIARPSHPPALCGAGDQVLCLRGGIFRVEVELVDPRTGEVRRAKSLPLTEESGAFWFFEEENVELFVKVLDGRPLNGHFWVFHGALTDVEYTLRITDEIDGHRVWSYHNPRGQMRSGADTRAF